MFCWKTPKAKKVIVLRINGSLFAAKKGVNGLKGQ